MSGISVKKLKLALEEAEGALQTEKALALERASTKATTLFKQTGRVAFKTLMDIAGNDEGLKAARRRVLEAKRALLEASEAEDALPGERAGREEEVLSATVVPAWGKSAADLYAEVSHQIDRVDRRLRRFHREVFEKSGKYPSFFWKDHLDNLMTHHHEMSAYMSALRHALVAVDFKSQTIKTRLEDARALSDCLSKAVDQCKIHIRY